MEACGCYRQRVGPNHRDGASGWTRRNGHPPRWRRGARRAASQRQRRGPSAGHHARLHRGHRVPVRPHESGNRGAAKAVRRESRPRPGKRIDTGTVGTAATAAARRAVFKYTIYHPVTLARQKSAMLPIVGKEVEGQKLSIYNQSVQRTHPLLGLKFRNTSGAHLNQGPITAFEGSVYAGDTRVLDVQPNEERLVSYAIDLGTEVDPQVGPGTQKITSVKAVKGIVTTVTKVTEEKKYRVVNRSQTDRTLLIEHANRTNQQFKLVDTEKPVEDTPD